MGFWILAAGIAAATIAILSFALFTGRGRGASTSDYDMQVYRDQLKELDRDLARGVVTTEEAERTKVEISRRLLEADRKAQAGEADERAPKELSLMTVGFVTLLVLGGSLWLYSDIGAPGYSDEPLQGRIAAAQERRENRPSQQEAEAQQPEWTGPPAEAPQEYVDLVQKLREAVADHPDQIQGHLLLVDHEAALGNFIAAEVAMKKVLELKGDSATAEDYSAYADTLVIAAGGYVSPEAERAINVAMGLNPKDGIARYYAGMMYAQTGRPDLAFRIWRDLLESSPPDAPWIAPISGQIQRLAAMAGVDYTPPAMAAPDMPGPSAEDMAAAQEMSAEDRAAMIEGMVGQLEDRLASEGGSAAEWAKLINALGVLGKTDHAAEIWAEAKAIFADDPTALDQINQAAIAAGVSE